MLNDQYICRILPNNAPHAAPHFAPHFDANSIRSQTIHEKRTTESDYSEQYYGVNIVGEYSDFRHW